MKVLPEKRPAGGFSLCLCDNKEINDLVGYMSRLQ